LAATAANALTRKQAEELTGVPHRPNSGRSCRRRTRTAKAVDAKIAERLMREAEIASAWAWAR
jgi:hypothetical protein